MTDRAEIYVASGLRSPFARIDRELSDHHGLDLSADVVQQSVAGARGPGLDRVHAIDLVLWGAVIPSLRVSNWGREVWFEAGLDPHVPAQGIVQACATSLAAATHAAGQVGSGRVDLALCGGVESMTSTEIGLTRGMSRTIRRIAQARGPGEAIRNLGQVRLSDLRLHIPSASERTTGMTMGEHAEETAVEWEISRDAQDRFALQSHEKAVDARDEGFFRRLLVSPGTFPLDDDALPRPDTSLEKLSALSPAFDRERGTVTAGNATPLTDGAAAVWVGSRDGMDVLPDDVPRVRLLDWEQAAVDIESDGLLMAPTLALPRLLARHDLDYGDVRLWEIHEAFAAQALCTYRALESETWLRERAGVERTFGRVPRQRVNPRGGSLALGHPFAATGARILSQAAAELADRPSGTKGVVSVCAAGGLGHVALLESP